MIYNIKTTIPFKILIDLQDDGIDHMISAVILGHL